jgi:hypothetical protein
MTATGLKMTTKSPGLVKIETTTWQEFVHKWPHIVQPRQLQHDCKPLALIIMSLVI